MEEAALIRVYIGSGIVLDWLLTWLSWIYYCMVWGNGKLVINEKR